MKPILKGYVWDIPFYPVINNYRTVKQVLFYDSSNDLEFVKFPDEYQILVPENLIQGTAKDILYVRENIDKIWADKDLILKTDHKGNWKLVIDKPQDWDKEI